MVHETPLPRSIAARSVKIVRPRDATGTYTNPAVQFHRLANAGKLVRVAHGYYAIPPPEWSGDADWRPTPESLALGIGIADYGRDDVVLSGVSAARLLGIPPRAIATAVVSIPVRRPPIDTISGSITFWHRSTAKLDFSKVRTEIATGWSATAEQALLDVADHPERGSLPVSTATEVIRLLAPRVDWYQVHDLSIRQQKRAAYARAAWVSSGLVNGPIPTIRPGRVVSTKGLTSHDDTDPRAFGLANDRR